MALDVLTLRTEEGQHTLSCPVGAVVDLGCNPACEIMLEGDSVRPHHCMLRRMGERHFRVTAIATDARFTVNGVSATDLGVDVPFSFGINGDTIEFDLASAAEVQAGAEIEARPFTLADEPESPHAESGKAAPEEETSTVRAARRHYLLHPGAVNARSGQRMGAMRAEPSTAMLSPVMVPATARKDQALDFTPANEEALPALASPLVPPPDQQPETIQPQPAGTLSPKTQPDDEGASPLLLSGLLVCVVMVAAIFWWKQELDAAETPRSTQGAASPTTRGLDALPHVDSLAAEHALRAGRLLRAGGASAIAGGLIMPVAERGGAEAMHEFAAALQDTGVAKPEIIGLLHQAAEGGCRQAWEDLVLAVEHTDNPQRFAESSFELLKRAAEVGIASAWLPLGERHEHGQGAPQDLRLALQAFERAQGAGDPRAAAKLSAKDAALLRVEAFVRSWNEVSVATLLDHVSATPGRYFSMDRPPMEALLRVEEDLRMRWPLRRIRVVPGAEAELQTFDLIKITQPFQFEVESGLRLAGGTGTLTCTVQRDTTGAWRVTDAADTITLTAFRPGKDKFVSATSLRTLSPALSREERVEEARQHILREMRDIEQTQDFKPALLVISRAAQEFPQEAWWRPSADSLCDRMARQLFTEGRWLDAAWAHHVHELAQAGSVSALLLEGHLHAAGYGCQRDDARSTALYQQAFEAGRRRDARFYYAEALFQGRGVPQDLQKADELVLSFMSRSKHPLEAYLAAHLLWRKAEKEPALWQQIYDMLSRVADKHPPARHLAAMVLLNHGNTRRERRTGFAALKAAAEAGVQEAMKNLSKCYQDGVGCESDFQAATLWKQKAAVTEPPRRKHYTEFAD